MSQITIISSSIRTGRKSDRVALYFQNYLTENKIATSEVLDLKKYNFPLFEAPLKYQKTPSEKTLEFAEIIKKSEGVILVAPEYNGGFPASLKNVIDLLYEEWRHKPIGIVTVSSGPFAATQALISLQFILWKIKAWTITEMFSVPYVETSYDENGTPSNKEESDKLASVFIKELLWCIKADKGIKK